MQLTLKNVYCRRNTNTYYPQNLIKMKKNVFVGAFCLLIMFSIAIATENITHEETTAFIDKTKVRRPGNG